MTAEMSRPVPPPDSVAASLKVSLSTGGASRLLISFNSEDHAQPAAPPPSPSPATTAAAVVVAASLFENNNSNSINNNNNTDSKSASLHVDPLLTVVDAAGDSLTSYGSIDAAIDYISPGLSGVAPYVFSSRTTLDSSINSDRLRWRVCSDGTSLRDWSNIASASAAARSVAQYCAD